MSKIRIELKWAIFFTMAALIWMLFEKGMGWHDEHIDKHAIYTNIFGIIAVIVFVFALLDKRNNYFKGRMTWKQGFLSGVVLSLFIAILSPLGQYITHEFITPDYFHNAIAYAVKSGNATLAEAQDYFNFKNYLVQSAVFALVIGIITSAIVAIFVRKQKIREPR